MSTPAPLRRCLSLELVAPGEHGIAHRPQRRVHADQNRDTEQGRGILGVIDGFKSKGVEGDEDIAWRKDFLRKIGYKF